MKLSRSFKYGNHTVTLETGHLAKQANGAVLVTIGKTVVLVTVVEKEAQEERDFFPLTVNYQERYYANGRFPGGFIKREGRPSVQETLIARLIDRPLRPLFPKGFTNEVQIITTVLSLDPDVLPDIPAMLGASAALELSGIPFNGPVAAARVGFCHGQLVLNPSTRELTDSKLDLVVAGTQSAVLMVESVAEELVEEDMLAAVMFGYQQMQTAIVAIKELAAECGTIKRSFELPKEPVWVNTVEAKVVSSLRPIFKISNKAVRNEQLSGLQRQITAEILQNHPEVTEEQVNNYFFQKERQVVRGQILNGEKRIDGRDNFTVRPITIDLGILPRAHGSAVFTRGETQALVVTTLGVDSDAQVVDTPTGESTERFMLHYNFLPFCTGEIGLLGSPKRRELGHGNLAKRALQAVLPSNKEFPYVIRLVSEITESNGSSSMATVCGGCLALMDAGVPIKAPVAGVAMGLIKENDQFVVLTDILGDEDHLGDMDFKVAGTLDGVTALQMDIKIDGITEEIMRIALKQAKDARMHIFDKMKDYLPAPRAEISDYAPRITTFFVAPDKIKDVIGKGGSVIRGLIEASGADINIGDDGKVTIATADKQIALDLQAKIKAIAAEVELGKIYEGVVTKILDFGAVVNILPNKDGLVHVSQIADEHVKVVSDYLHEGDKLRVKVIEIDERTGKIRLSAKQAANEKVEPLIASVTVED